MAGLALHALTVGTETAVILAFSTAAATIVLIMILLMIIIGMAQNQFLQPLQASSQQIKRGGGLILILVGIWLMILAIWANVFAQLFSV